MYWVVLTNNLFRSGVCMESIINITNLKSLLLFFHLAGLAMGVGGAWMLDVFLVRHSGSVISKEKFDVIEFVSRFVLFGLLILWVSGFAFIAFYYFFTPELLSNQKVWAKLFVVSVLSVNGYFIHSYMLPKLRRYIGRNLIRSAPTSELRMMAIMGTVSFVSWLFPIILGVAKTLNFSMPAIDIISFYLVVVLCGVVFALGVEAYLSKVRYGTPRSTVKALS